MQVLLVDPEQNVIRVQPGSESWVSALRKAGAWVLIGLGLLQFVAGTAVTFLPSAA